MPKARAFKRILTIPSGAPFLKTFARGLMDGAIIPGFPDPDHRLSLVSATIYVPTQRAADALRNELITLSDRGVALLPTIVPLGRVEIPEQDLAENSSPLEDEERTVTAEVSEFERRLILANLVMKWAAEIQRAIIAIDSRGNPINDDKESILVGTSFASAWSLAGELGGLIDEFAIEGIEWAALGQLMPDEFDKYWGITLQFLKIAFKVWPEYLRERKLVDRAANQAFLVEKEIARIKTGDFAGPVIIAGSTGANATTARLLDAVASTERGAVVLPGLDIGLDNHAWSMLTGEAGARADPVVTHPQAAMARLLKVMGARRSEIVSLGNVSERSRVRFQLISEALRPAETTDVWRTLHENAVVEQLALGLEDVALIEAVDEREEALSIAIKLRESIELGRTIALVTPDRNIARRVKAQMARWGVEIDDSAGESLGRTIFGSYARLILGAALERNCAAMTAVLNHSIARYGRELNDLDRIRRHLDIGVLRSAPNLTLTPGEIIDIARERSRGRGAHLNAKAISDEDWSFVQSLLGDFDEALRPLTSVSGSICIAEWAVEHKRAIELSNPSTHRNDGDGSAELESSLAEMIKRGRLGEPIDLPAYVAFFDQLCATVAVRRGRKSGAPVQILGLLEARLMDFDAVVLAGLDEGVWPPDARTDPFLNRSMRASLGMSPPERRIGQTSHDFVQLLGASKALLTRSLKRDGAPTVPSRLIQRIAAMVGNDRWNKCVARGSDIRWMSRNIDRVRRTSVAAPKPSPPVEDRPQSLSVTRIETLRRDPYSIYAEMVLRLLPLNTLDLPLGARDFGVSLHEVISTFTRDIDLSNPSSSTIARLFQIARHEFQEFFKYPGFQEFSWPRLVRILNAYRAWEMDRIHLVEDFCIEQSAVLKIPLEDGSIFDLVARADRIERHRNGSICIVDFKSGRTPSPREIGAGFAPQLVLEAKMVEDGAFRGMKSINIEAIYVKLGGPDGIELRTVGDEKRPLGQLIEDQFEGLKSLLNQMKKPEFAFVSRPYPQFSSRFGAYDHLARVKEWSAGADVGAGS